MDGVADNSLVTPDDTGYTGMMLKSVTRGAKNLFIAPIQEELSTNHLPQTDEAFSNMPKTTEVWSCSSPSTPDRTHRVL